MSIFGTIMQKIFGSNNPIQANTNIETTTTNTIETNTLNKTENVSLSSNIDISVVLDNLVNESKEKLNWKTSIVDLMKLVGMDSSLSNRKELAKELNYKGDENDSASMNIWLHKQVMTKLSENGGVVPPDLLN